MTFASSIRTSSALRHAASGAALGGSLFCGAEPLAPKRRPLAAETAAWAPAPAKGRSRLVFTGTGNSTGTPRPYCFMQADRCDPACRVSRLAMEGPPERNKNYRGNPGMLIQYATPQGDRRNYQIDTGKTYRESLIRWYPRFGVPWIDAVILTHDHADAMMGLDELRTVQRLPRNLNTTAMASQRDAIPALPVFVGARHMPSVRRCFPYLVKPIGSVARFTAKIDWIETSDYETFVCPGGLAVTTLPVEHGSDYICQAFVFGEKQRVAYLSDVTNVPEKTMEVLRQRHIDVLVLDCLYEDTHAVHFGIKDAIAFAKAIRPARTLLVGMSDQFEHDETNARLREHLKTDSVDIQLAHDGLFIDVEL